MIRTDQGVFCKGRRGNSLIRLRFPSEEHEQSWKPEQAFRTGEAAKNHCCRERGQYDMMCCQEGPTGVQINGGGPGLCLTRPCQAPSCLSTGLPRLISSSRDQVELPASPPRQHLPHSSIAVTRHSIKSSFLSPTSWRVSTSFEFHFCATWAGTQGHIYKTQQIRVLGGYGMSNEILLNCPAGWAG